MIVLRARPGVLIPIVLVVMVIIALAACAALFAARQERRAGWASRLQTSAQGAADRAHADALGTFAAVAPMLAQGGSEARTLAVDDGVDATVRLTRLGPTLFALFAGGSAHSPQGLRARRRAALLLRLDPPSLDFPAALSVVGGSPPEPSVADGADRSPSGWPCDAVATDAAATRHPSAGPDTLVLALLRQRATIALPSGATLSGIGPVVRDGACATDRPDNWGDPDRTGPCASWLPVIHAPGDLTVEGGAGQGVLLVDGNLKVAGGFRFVGAVIVVGGLDIGSGGATIIGGVIAGQLHDASGSAGAAPIVHRSRCVTDAALVAAGTLVPLVDRPWVSVR